MKTLFVLLMASMVLTGCAKTIMPPLKLEYNDPANLSIGQTAAVGGEVTVRFNAVTNDSRCPTGSNCATQGNAAVSLNVDTPSSDPTDVILNTAADQKRQEKIGAFTITLHDLSPFPSVANPIDPATYMVRVTVTRDK